MPARRSPALAALLALLAPLAAVPLVAPAGAGPAPAASSYCSLGYGTHPLGEGVAASGTITNVYGSCDFTFVPSPTADSVTVELSSPGGAQSRATVLADDGISCQVQSYASPNRCTVPFVEGATPRVMVYWGSGAGGQVPFTVTARSSSTCSLGRGWHPASPGQSLAFQLQPDGGGACLFEMATQPSEDLLRVTATTPGPHPEVRLWETTRDARYHFIARCSGEASSPTHACQLANNVSSTFHALVRIGGTAGTPVTLAVEGVVLPTLGSGPATPIAVPGETRLYKAVAAPGQDAVRVVLAGPARLGVSRGEIPGTNEDDVTCNPDPALRVSVCTFDDDLYAAAGSQACCAWRPLPFRGPGKYFVGVTGTDGGLVVLHAEVS